MALLLAAVLAAVMPGCAARTIIDAIVDGDLPLTSATPEPATPVPAAPSAAASEYAPAAETPATETPLAQEMASGRLIPFPEMQYSRPDVDGIVTELNVLAETVRLQSDADAAVRAVDQANSIYDDFETEIVLAMIHSSIDRSDAYWQTEYAFCTDAAPRINQALTAVSVALQESPAGQEAGLEPVDNLFDATGVMDLISEQSRLINQYQTLLATLTASSEGETFTVSQATTASRYAAWLDQNAQTLGEVYMSLLRVRQQIAQAVGYQNFIEYSFDVRGSGFTVEMVQELLDRIARMLVPVDTAVRDNIETPTLELSETVMMQAMHNWMPRLDSDFDSSLNIMENYQLYDFSNGATKDPTALTTYIPSYDAPFMLVSYDGSYNSLKDVLHEFGHFNNYALDPGSVTASPDIGEVFSTGLALLCSDFFEESFGTDMGSSMQKKMLADSLSTFTYQSYFVGFELAAYSLAPEQMTYENLCRISEEQWYRFGMPNSSIASTDWTSTTHIVESPFYVLSYILATDAALQIWEQSIDDVDGAVDTYFTLMNNSASGMDFMSNIADAGLYSPFTEYEIALQAAYFTACLAAGQSPQEARAAHLATLGIQPAEAPASTEAPSEPTLAPATPMPTAPPVEEQPASPTADPAPEGSRPRVRSFLGYTDGTYTIPLN